MGNNGFENFILNVLNVVQDFAAKNNSTVTFGLANQKGNIYENGKSPLDESYLYYINPPSSNGRYYLRFRKINDDHFTVFIDNGSISLTLSQDLERLTNYPSNHFNNCIDNVKGSFKERLMTFLNFMFDFWYALAKLFEE